MGTGRGTRRHFVATAYGLALTAVAIALPHAGCAEPGHGDAIVLRGHPGQSVTFRPAHGDLPATGIAADARR